jgi:hypothetical protein
MMNLDEAIKLENQLYNALKDDELDKFEELLKVREGLYKSFAAESRSEFGAYLNSEAFNGSREKINTLYDMKKESLMSEMQELDRSRKAAEGYMGSSNNAPNIFSRSV